MRLNKTFQMLRATGGVKRLLFDSTEIRGTSGSEEVWERVKGAVPHIGKVLLLCGTIFLCNT